jgi:uncharacterized protein (DUF2147 family)
VDRVVNFSVALYLIAAKTTLSPNWSSKIRPLLIVLFLASLPRLAFADPIEGAWKRPNGVLVRFTACGKFFCASPITTKFAGQPAGKLAPNGHGHYEGELIDLEVGKTYQGKAIIAGDAMTLSGCIFGGLLCKSEAWIRQ